MSHGIIADNSDYPPMSSDIRYILHYLENKKVLDIGCGPGVYLKTFKWGSIGIDLEKANFNICKKKGLNVIHLNLNTEHLPFQNEYFDAVFCSHVLEHVENPIRLLREIKRVLSQNGIAIIGLLIEKPWIRIFFREDYYLDHPGHIFSFFVIGRKTLFNYVGFIHIALYFDLPKCRGHLGGAFLDFYQHFQCVLKERISPAYWLVCKKAR